MMTKKKQQSTNQLNHHHPRIDAHLHYPMMMKQQVIEMDFHDQELNSNQVFAWEQ